MSNYSRNDEYRDARYEEIMEARERERHERRFYRLDRTDGLPVEQPGGRWEYGEWIPG